MPSNSIAPLQHAPPQEIDTACHGVRIIKGAVECLNDAGVLRNFHISVEAT
jgi:hypothetical protein